MLDYMKFNKSNWYECEQEPYIGKYAYSSKPIDSLTVDNGTLNFYANDAKTTPKGLKITGEILQAPEQVGSFADQTIRKEDVIYTSDGQYFRASDVTIKSTLGGVISPLICFLRRLCRPLRRAVIA